MFHISCKIIYTQTILLTIKNIIHIKSYQWLNIEKKDIRTFFIIIKKSTLKSTTKITRYVLYALTVTGRKEFSENLLKMSIALSKQKENFITTYFDFFYDQYYVHAINRLQKSYTFVYLLK